MAARDWLAGHGVEFDAVDVTESRANLRRLAELNGRTQETGTPALDLGDRVLRRFRPDEWAAALGLPPAAGGPAAGDSAATRGET